MSHSIFRLPKTAKRSIFFHRDKASQLFAATLGFITTACPCSKPMAENLLPTPDEEIFVRDEETKESSLLGDLINHNAYIGIIPPFSLDPNSTSVIFAMNHENEQGAKKDENSKESEGAEGEQPQSLMTIPLPPMSHAEVSDIILKLNTSIEASTLNTMLSYVPETLPNESLTIESMIEQVQQIFGVVANNNQKAMIEVLSHIRGIESPVNLTRPQQKQNLAMLIVAYYTAINLSKLSTQEANDLFNSFLLHATVLSGIERLRIENDELLGLEKSIDKPTEDHKVLKATIKKSAAVIYGLKSLQEMRLYFLQQLENDLAAEKSDTPVDPKLKATLSLLNYGIYKNGIPHSHRNIESAQRMLCLLEHNGKKNPELAALNIQILTFIDAISLILDPAVIQFESKHIDNLSSYFSALNSDDPTTDSSETRDKQQSLFEIFKKALTDAKTNPGNENPELFQELLITLQKHIEQQLLKIHDNSNDYTTIMLTLTTGFQDLLKQSRIMLAMLETTVETNANDQADDAKSSEPADGQERKEFREKKQKIKHLEERVEYLVDFFDWFYDFATKYPYDSDTIDPDRYIPESLDGVYF
ncbi:MULTISPECIES: hypothetical protein [unclassified Endozoicomonas]|uniref:hypothetical protein n=1 Tax=unclassified Endozoicomonas TaxID=2644528 RepID=UPI0021488785|nr:MULTISPECIES: hypothetical protein [unclassified Endozoicomonas]